MNKTILFLIFLIAFLLLTNTAIERALSNGLWQLGRGVATETEYVADKLGDGFLSGIEYVRSSIGSTVVHYRDAFKYDIDNDTANKSILSYVFYIGLLFLSLFFIYPLLFYILIFLVLYWLYIIIRNRF